MSEKQPSSNSSNNNNTTKHDSNNSNNNNDNGMTNKIGHKQFILEKPVDTIFTTSNSSSRSFITPLTPEQQERLKMIDPKQAMMLYFVTSTFFSRLFAHPLDRISTILRTQHVLPNAYGTSFYTNLPTAVSSSFVQPQQQAPFRGAIDALKKLPKDRTLWRGLAPDVYG